MREGAAGSAAGRRALRLSAHDRLRKRFEFRRVSDQGRRVHTRSFLVLIARRTLDEPSRLGITVTKQVGNAVRRNRLKRLVREVFRQNRSLFPLEADVVVIAKRGCRADSYAEVREEMITASPAMVAATSRRGVPRQGAEK